MSAIQIHHALQYALLEAVNIITVNRIKNQKDAGEGCLLPVVKVSRSDNKDHTGCVYTSCGRQRPERGNSDGAMSDKPHDPIGR